MPDTDRNSDPNSDPATPEATVCPTPEMVQEELGISKSAYYDWIKYLSIKASKENGRAFLTLAEFDRLKELKMWFTQHNRLGGFLESEKQDSADGDRLGELAVSGGGELAEDSGENIYTSRAVDVEAEAVGDEDALFDRAARVAAKRMTFPAELVSELAGRIGFDDLPEHLQQQVTAATAAASPNFLNPATVARSLLEKRRGQQSQSDQKSLTSA
jgi:hypothetical protein